MKLKSGISLIIVLGVFVYITFFFAKNVGSFGISQLVPMPEYNCKTIYHELGERNVILRIDDIQANFGGETQIRMIEDALNRGKTLTLGVIPYGLQNDVEIYSILNQNKCDLEIAMHGYSHGDKDEESFPAEFEELSFKQANENIEKGLKILHNIEPNIITFIPPINKYSREAEKAVYYSGMKIISAGHHDGEYGFTQSTFNWDKKKLFYYQEVIDDCNNTLNQNKTCIIMIHPQDYTTDSKFDPEKYRQYIKLLDGLNELNAKTITFRDLYYRDFARL